MVAGGCRVLGDRRVAAMYSEVLFAPMYEGQASFWDLHETLTMKHGFALWQIYPLHRDASGRAPGATRCGCARMRLRRCGGE